MRVGLAERHYAVAPGVPFEITLEVFNPSTVIDGVRARMVGISPSWVECNPYQLSLFPDTGGTMSLRVTVPSTYPAGDHHVTVEVVSDVDASSLEVFDVVLSVAEESDASLRLHPSEVIGGGKAAFDIVSANLGNTPLTLTFTGTDSENALRFTFPQPFVQVEPGTETTVPMAVAGRRPLVGSAHIRPITVTALGPGHQLTAAATFTQKPRVPRGVLTILVLLAILGLWATVFTVGVNKVVKDEDFAKAVPSTFFDRASDGDSAQVAGTVSGTVTAISNGDPVPRMTVEAVRQTRDGPKLVGAAATDDEGAYTLEALTPGTYKLRLTAPGYQEQWYPQSPSEDGADRIKVAPLSEVEAKKVGVTGLPGTITGQVQGGAQNAPVPVVVAVRPVRDEVRGEVIAVTNSDATGAYLVAGLETPGTFELTFTAGGFEEQTATETLAGGEQLVANTVRLSAGPGSISGTVSDGRAALGGVTVTATSGETTFASATPTAGLVGTYNLTDLPTPGTYVLTFEKAGFGIETIAIDLGPGEQRTGLDITLVGGTGSIAGLVTNSEGVPLGGVEVTVTGGDDPVTTMTLTSGKVGTYVITGLVTPGRYTVTFSLENHTSQTLAVALETSGFAEDINARLAPATASVTGTVLSNGVPLAGATLEISDGALVRPTVSASEPPGAYAITGLTPGSYTITVSALNRQTRTVLIVLEAGQHATVDVDVPAV